VAMLVARKEILVRAHWMLAYETYKHMMRQNDQRVHECFENDQQILEPVCAIQVLDMTIKHPASVD
jgi:hypothetical protein